MISDPHTIEVRDESTKSEQRFCLYVDGCERGMVTKGPNKRVQIHWKTAGPFQAQEGRVWIQGLLELSIISQELECGEHYDIKETIGEADDEAED